MHRSRNILEAAEDALKNETFQVFSFRAIGQTFPRSQSHFHHHTLIPLWLPTGVEILLFFDKSGIFLRGLKNILDLVAAFTGSTDNAPVPAAIGFESLVVSADGPCRSGTTSVTSLPPPRQLPSVQPPSPTTRPKQRRHPG